MSNNIEKELNSSITELKNKISLLEEERNKLKKKGLKTDEEAEEYSKLVSFIHQLKIILVSKSQNANPSYKILLDQINSALNLIDKSGYNFSNRPK